MVIVMGALLLVILPAAGRSPRLDLGVLPETAKAQATGKPVEVVGERTTTETVWANPDGYFRREISTVPVRARVGKAWVPIDLDLTRGSDGKVRPKAPPEPTALSGGGDTALLVTQVGGVQISTDWPEKLPAPVLDGATATYADVFPDVDLRMTVTDAGTSQILVVKNRQAARNPALRRIVLDTDVDGGILRSSNGGFAIVDAKGREVGAAPQPLMWDSKKSPAARDANKVAEGASASVFEGPSESDDVTAVRTTVSRKSVVLRPEVEALTGPDVSYPVFIDPQISPSTVDWTGIRKENPTASYYKWTYASLHAGFQGTQLQRLFWRFSTSSLAGATIRRATFVGRLKGTHACAPHGMQLWRTSVISSTTTWNNQPSWSSHLDTNTDQAAGGCGLYGRRSEFAVTSAVASVAAAPYSSVTFGMRAHTETSDESAKWFDHEATLNVIYKFPPDVPTNLHLADPTLACGTSPVPTIGGVKPRLSTYLTSPDYDNLKVQFYAYSGSTVSGSPIWAETVSAAGSHGSRFTSATRVEKPDGTLPNGTYTWQVRAVDPDPDYTDLSTDWVTCTFKVDGSLVGPPGIIVPGGAAWSIDAAPVAVTLDPTANVNDPTPSSFAYYRWSVNSQTPTSTAIVPTTTDRRATIAVTPTKTGPNVIRVWAYNTAGSVSESTAYKFEPQGGGEGYSAQYLFDEGNGTTSVDQAGAHDLSGMTEVWTKRGGYRADGSLPSANKDDYLVRLAGSEPAPPRSAGPVVATNESFTVSAWVRPDEVADRVAVSQGTAAQSNFTLGTSTACTSPVAGCYRFGVRNSAGAMIYVESSRTVAEDLAVAPPAKPRMVHLVGDVSKSGVIRLRVMVDGVVTESRATSTAPSQVSDGPLLIGGARSASAYAQKWKGDLDNIMLKQGLLDDVALVQLHTSDGGRCYADDRIDQGPTSCAN